MSIIVCAFEAQKDETPEAGGGHAHARNSERALKIRLCRILDLDLSNY